MADLENVMTLLLAKPIMYMQNPSTSRFKHTAIYIGNLLISSLLLVLLLSNLFIFAWRVIRAHQLDKAW